MRKDETMRSFTDSQGFEVTEADCYEARTGICSFCGEECEVGIQDDSFDYSYGSINGTHRVLSEVSSCCGEEVLEGGVAKFVDRK